MSNQYSCAPGCPRVFSIPKSRTIHQNHCQWYQKSLEEDNIDNEAPRPAKRRRVGEPDLVLVEQEAITAGDELDSTHQSSGSEPEQSHQSTSESTSTHARPFTRSQALRVRSGFRITHDALPDGPRPLSPVPEDANQLPDHQTRSADRRQVPRRNGYRTSPDFFGRYRVYTSRPLTIPDLNAPMAHILPRSARRSRSRPVNEIIHPCPNLSVFYVQRYYWLNGNTKSLADRDLLVGEAILQPDFNPQDLVGINLREIDNQLANTARNWDPNFPPVEGWKNIPLSLEVPRLRNQLNQDPFYLEIPGLRARSLVDIMRKTFSSNNTSTFHYEPFHEYYKPPGSSMPPQPISGEMYTSPAMIHAHREVQTLEISDRTCTLPRCVSAFMFSSDGMQFAQFSHVKGWPILCYFGNESKYERCKPSSNTCYAAAHIPTLPDSVKDDITTLYNGKPPTEALLTHLRRELMHAVWNTLIDEVFVDAWKNGVIIDCADGIRRRVFPRIMTYSADYPEKVLLATIRNGGKCLCPRCLVQKSAASQVGTTRDMNTRKHKRRKDNEKYRDKVARAREFIYAQGRPVQSKAVEDLLKEESYVPTVNAFSQLGGELGFNIFSSLVVDQLHEVELGVWKALFKHLIRLLHLNGSQALAEFNKRFRSVPSFGPTIRMFADDVASMSRIAARDFEDILQCCIPVFDGLLPEICDEPAQKLLFIFAQWHGMAKLRLHTKCTLAIFKSLTVKLAATLREFAELTKSLEVRETPQEYARRKKRSEAAKASSMARGGQTMPRQPNQPQNNSNPGDGRRICVLNLDTYKAHALGDYVRAIEEYGTTDSYSSQIGELQGRKFKVQYLRTNKHSAVEQMTRVGDITDVLHEMDQELTALRNAATTGWQMDEDAVTSLLDGQPFSIGIKDRSEDMIPNVALWVSQRSNDPAIKYFLPQLKRHLLSRVLGHCKHPDNHDGNLSKVQFAQERIYQHNTLRINYTSYDVLRQQDCLGVSSHQCFAVLPTEAERHPDEHPFIYAKILGIYHAKIIYDRRPPKRYEFVHVRWLYYDYDRPGGWAQHRLDRLCYQRCQTEQDILDAFDFVDPRDIIRATHLIPDFRSGITRNYISHALSVGHDKPDGTDWSAYYVNRFVDRDMLMRYIGGGIGHYQLMPSETAVHTDGSSGRDLEDEDEHEEQEDGDYGTDDVGVLPEQAREEEQAAVNRVADDYDSADEYDGNRLEEDEGQESGSEDDVESAAENGIESDDDVEF